MRLDYTTVIRDWPSRCPCGAAAAERYGLCPECQARAYWSRRKARRPRHARSTVKRLGRRAVRLLAPAAHPAPAADNQASR